MSSFGRVLFQNLMLRLASPAGKEILLYALGAALTVAILTLGMRLDRADFQAPFSYDFDALLILPFVKETVEGGHHWHTPRLGAPAGQDLHDFPVIDHLHLLVIRLLGWFWSSPEAVFNLYYVLTYPLTTLGSILAARRLGLSRASALLVGLLYAFQPYHYLRGQTHYFLSAYYVVPLTVLSLVEIARGKLPFFVATSAADGVKSFHRSWRNAHTFWAIAIAVLTSAAGAYYAFFACAFYVAAGLYAWMATRTVRAPLSAAAIVAIVSGCGLLHHLPTIVYQAENGRNNRPHVRLAEEAEIYGMKVAQLVLPVPGHNPVGLGDTVVFDPAAMRSAYQAPVLKELNESDWDPIGLIASIGYLSLLALCVLPARRGETTGPFAAFALYGTFLGTVGGLGALFNVLVSPQVRCYNRVSIYLAFFALLFVGRSLDLLFARCGTRAAALRSPIFVFLLAFGIWDQTNDQWFPDFRSPKPGYTSLVDQRNQAADRYYADREFFGRVETLLPEGMVFNFPFIEYPEARTYAEAGASGSVQSYESTLGYLHTRSLRWSFGSMKGREWDTWMRRLTGKEPPPQFLERIALVGFEGLLVDARGLNPRRWNNLKLELDQYLGPGALREVHPARRLYFFDLRNFRDTLIRSYGAAGFEARRTQELESLMVLWLKGFASYEPNGYEDRSRWCGETGQAVVVNRSQTTKAVTFSMKFRTIFKDRGALTIDADLADEQGNRWAETLEINGVEKPPEIERTLIVPPGRWTIRFRCRPYSQVLPADSRRELFTVLDFKMK